MSGLLIALLCGFVLGMVLRRPQTKLVMESESETITRLRAGLQADLNEIEQALLAPRCGWSEADDLRTGMRLIQRLMGKLPEPAQ